jgi:hypothetical protein
MGLCLVSDVRVLTGVSEAMLSDADIEGLIAFSDQQIEDDVGSQSAPVPARIKHLSALLTAIKIYTRPDLRGGFSVGDITISNQQVEEALNRWTRDISRIYSYYGQSVQENPSTLKSV